MLNAHASHGGEMFLYIIVDVFRQMPCRPKLFSAKCRLSESFSTDQELIQLNEEVDTINFRCAENPKFSAFQRISNKVHITPPEFWRKG